MRINWGIIKLFVLLGLVAFLMSFAKQRNERRNITDVKINFVDDHQPFITLATVNKLLIQSNDSITSIPKETLVLKEMEGRLRQNPMVRKAQVFVTIDGVLGAQIEQRNPIARVAGSANYYIDEDGKEMPLSNVYSARVPLISGSSKNGFTELTPLLIKIKNDSVLNQLVTGIHEKQNGEVILNLRKQSFKVLFGSIENMEVKFKNFKAFFQKIKKDNKSAEYQLVDLRFGNQVVASKI